MYNNIEIIAEVKTLSPFGWQSEYSWDELFEVADKVGDMISVHTDSRWGGSFELIKKARQRTKKPILAKGIHTSDEDIVKAIEAGADYVLVVGRIPGVHQDKCIIEPLTLLELKNIPESYKVVWNTRNLKNGFPKEETFEEARKLRKGWLCQASNIKNINDIKKGADAVLIGTHLVEFSKSLNVK
jgi:indole-3-glycerol phosphate synthase